MKEYDIKVTNTTIGFYPQRANSEEEAIKIVESKIASGEYSSPEEFENETYEVVGYKVIDGTELEQGYIKEMDVTVIWEYTYEEGEVIKEQIVGYYHGEPTQRGLIQFAYKGTIGKFD